MISSSTGRTPCRLSGRNTLPLQTELYRTRRIEAAVVIQRAFRLHQSFEATLSHVFWAEVHVARRWESARVIQTTYRMYVHNAFYKNTRFCILAMQRMFRGHKSRQEFAHLIAVRNARLAAAQFINPRLQARLRGRQAREMYQQMKVAYNKASLVIQRLFRGFWARKMWAILLAQMHASCRLVQFHYRGHLYWKAYLEWQVQRRRDIAHERVCACRIQRLIRRVLAKAAVARARAMQAAGAITLQVQGVSLRCFWRVNGSHTCPLQRLGRGYFARKQYTVQRHVMNMAARRIQKCYREYKEHLARMERYRVRRFLVSPPNAVSNVLLPPDRRPGH